MSEVAKTELETLSLERLSDGQVSESQAEEILHTLEVLEKPPPWAVASSPRVHEQKEKASIPSLYLDGYTPLAVPRESRSSYPVEMLYRFSVAKHAANATHIYLPFNGKKLSGSFVRKWHVHDREEYGLSEVLLGPNPMSMFPNVAFGAAERLHIVSHQGDWPTQSVERVRAERKGRWWFQDRAATALRYMRTFSWFIFLKSSGLPGQFTNAFVDANHVAKVWEFARTDDGFAQPPMQPTSHLSGRANALSQLMNDKAANAESFKASTGAASNCIHFTNDPNLQVTYGSSGEPTGVYLPLGKKMVIYKGSTVFSPIQRLDIAVGTSFLTYHPEEEVLQMYFGASSFGELVDPLPTEAVARYVVSPADSQDMPIEEDGRHATTYKPSWAMYGLYKAAFHQPADYEYLYEDPQQLCPDDKFKTLAKEAADMDLSVMLADPPPPATQKLALINHLVKVMDCGTSFLRGVEKNSNAVGMLEMSVWAHFLMEGGHKTRLYAVNGWFTVD